MHAKGQGLRLSQSVYLRHWIHLENLVKKDKHVKQKERKSIYLLSSLLLAPGITLVGLKVALLKSGRLF